MKTSKTIIIIISLILVLVGLITTTGKKEDIKKAEKEIEKETVPVYKTDYKCSISNNEDVDGNELISTSNIYVDVDSKNNVKTVIYQSISDINNYNQSLMDMSNSLMETYNSIKGIEGKIKSYDKYIVTEIKYDYKKLDINNVKSELKNILDDDSIFNKVKSTPISFEIFKQYELRGYKCK